METCTEQPTVAYEHFTCPVLQHLYMSQAACDNGVYNITYKHNTFHLYSLNWIAQTTTSMQIQNG